MDIGVLLYKKVVDWSVLNYGLTIPVSYHGTFFSANDEVLQPGDKRAVILYHEDREYECTFVNVDRKGVSGDTLQIRYNTNNPIVDLFRQNFGRSLNYIEIQRQQQGTGPVSVPFDVAQYVGFYSTGIPYRYQMRLWSKSEKERLVENLKFKNMSYKLVLLSIMLANVNSVGQVPLAPVVEKFSQFYLNRHQDGLVVERPTAEIVNIASMDPNEVKALILKNPYAAFARHGFISLSDDEEFLLFGRELWSELAPEDLGYLKEYLNKEIDRYYSQLGVGNMQSGLSVAFSELFSRYKQVRESEQFAGHELGTLVRRDVPEYIRGLSFVDDQKYVNSGLKMTHL